MYSKNIIIAGPHLNFDTGINFQLQYLINLLKEKTSLNVIYCNIGKSDTNITNKFNFPIYNIKSANDLINVIDKYNIKALISSHDLVKLDTILFAKISRCFYWIHYFMSESDNHDIELVTQSEEGISKGSLNNIINHIDKFICATQTTKLAYYDIKYQQKQVYEHTLDVDVINSFIDFSFSFSQENRNIIRKSLNLHEDDFLFLVVARNQPRKNLPIYFEAIQKVNTNIKHLNIKAKLFVLSWPISNFGYDLEYLKNYYKLEGYVFLRDISNYTTEFNNSLLNDIYCAADTLLSCPYAEGFGYPIFEALLCDTPVLLSNTIEANFILQNKNLESKVTILPKGNDFFFPSINQKWSYTDINILVPNILDHMTKVANKKNENRDNLLSTFVKTYFTENRKSESEWLNQILLLNSYYNLRGIK